MEALSLYWMNVYTFEKGFTSNRGWLQSVQIVTEFSSNCTSVGGKTLQRRQIGSTRASKSIPVELCGRRKLYLLHLNLLERAREIHINHLDRRDDQTVTVDPRSARLRS